MISQSFGEPEHAWAIGITAPTMIIACSNDQIASVEAAREIEGRIKGAQLIILEVITTESSMTPGFGI
jgi:hypothetical protein